MDKRLHIVYKEQSHKCSGGNHLEFKRNFCPARRSIRGAALSAIDAGASLLGIFTQDQRDAVYVALWGDQWVGLLSFFASALKCAARDGWIGWSSRHRYDRLRLIVNNSRFLILPDWHIPNLGSRILSLCQRRLDNDWQKAFGHPAVMLETFVDPKRFLGAVYKAANWNYVGNTKGFRRTRHGYTATTSHPKWYSSAPYRRIPGRFYASLFSPLTLSYRRSQNDAQCKTNAISPVFFSAIHDPRRAQGRRHRLATVLAIAAGACLCGMRGYRAIADWANSLGKNARQRFGCRNANSRYIVPSELSSVMS